MFTPWVTSTCALNAFRPICAASRGRAGRGRGRDAS
jgi:hypothetical protein